MPPLESQADLLRRIAEALDALRPLPAKPDFEAAEAFVWRADRGALAPVKRVNRVDLSLLRGIDRVRDLLVENTQRFARALPANNALLWGARGMGKSSLVKAAHAAINREGEVAGASTGRDPSRGHRGPAGANERPARGALSVHCLLRRPFVRRRRHVL